MDMMKSNLVQVMFSNHKYASLEYDTDKLTTTNNEEDCIVKMIVIDQHGAPTNTVMLKVK